jgi:EmrB/QacA subfamily drug resistance transporter
MLILDGEIAKGSKKMNATAASAERQAKAYARRWWILLVLSLSLVIIVVDNTIVNVALPVLQRKLRASASDLQWIVDSYLVVFAGLLLVMGTLGDCFGRKRALQGGLLLFGLASLAAAAAQSSAQLIGARMAMGIGGALIMPATLAILVAVFPTSERSKALGVWTGVAALGIPLGPIIGGWLIDQFWWGAIFLLNVPVVVVALAGGLFLIPESRHPSAPAIDLLGAALSAGTLASLVYGLVEAPIRGWLDPVVLGAFGGALLLCAIFVSWELRMEQPLLDVRLFRHPRFGAGTTAIAIATLALTGLTFLLTQYLQVVRHYSPLEAGARVLPLSLGFLVGAGMSHRLLERLGTRWVVTAALILLAGTLLGLSYLAVDSAYWVLGVGLGCFGVGLGGATVPSTDAVMGAVPVANAGVGSAVNDAARQVGAALGVAVLGSVLNSAYSAQMAGATAHLSSAAAAMASNSVGGAAEVAAHLGGRAGIALQEAANAAYMVAFADATRVGMALVLAGTLLVLARMPALRRLPQRRAVAAHEQEDDHVHVPGGGETDRSKTPSFGAT